MNFEVVCKVNDTIISFTIFNFKEKSLNVAQKHNSIQDLYAYLAYI